ncbi:hypothetical protein B0H34DRAFT_796321 [Crassisporium funariophilum]|nr:hypothetical protein B0H34DRAFT_796321 [Crassisporium funariophilum]
MADLVLQPYHPALLQEPVPNAPNADSSSTNVPSTPPPASHRRDVSSTTVPPSTPFSQDSNTMLVDGALPPETISDINKRVALLTGATYHAIWAFFALRNNLGVGGERGEGGNGPGAPPNSRVGMGR